MGTPQSRLQRVRTDILIRREERKTTLINTAEGVHIEDTEEVPVFNVLAVHNVIHVNRVRCRDTCPGHDAARTHHQHAFVTHHHEETPLAICLVCHRVSRKDVVWPVSPQVSPLHRDRIDELLARRGEFCLIPLNVRGGQQERRALKCRQKTFDVNHQRRHDILRGCLTADHLHLQLVGRILTKNIREGPRRASLGLYHREVNLQKSVLGLPALAVDDANVGLGVHRSAGEVPPHLLLLAKREPQSGLGDVDHVLSIVSEVAGLTLHLELCALEAVCCADLVDILSPLHDHAKAVRIREGGVNRFDSRSGCERFDGFHDAVGDVLGLNLAGKNLAFEFGVGVLDVGCKVFKVPPCTRREKRLHCHC